MRKNSACPPLPLTTVCSGSRFYFHMWYKKNQSFRILYCTVTPLSPKHTWFFESSHFTKSYRELVFTMSEEVVHIPLSS